MNRSMSFRGKRLERRADEQRRGGTLNLVSLMDIFTILVFFLLVNSSAVEVLPAPRAMTLPESIADTRAREVAVIMITRDEIFLQYSGNVTPVGSAAEAANAEGATLPALRAALQRDVDLLPIEGDEEGGRTRGEINIMADKETPFSALKRVMATATQADFANVSLTVLQTRGGQGGS
ncbi:biopolymer transporter ExbD [Algiphilus sp.]|uniref:ExbD/TolR family protein n=1 Tax=Algiphilus sp. TaxID=1872431 RepID=UPI0025C5EB50|nr:biopolymer transporter ExbD [Algiphilus sp.]MCK5771686.1 biopolymer transporter ExbD [Algiphilus sp.]